MGLAKISVDVKSLATMLLDENGQTLRKLWLTEDFPRDSKIYDAKMEGNNLSIILTHQLLPEPSAGYDAAPTEPALLEARVMSEEYLVTEDQQLRLDRYEHELRNIMAFIGQVKSMDLEQANKYLAQIGTRVLAVLRHEDAEKVIETSGAEVLSFEAFDNKS